MPGSLVRVQEGQLGSCIYNQIPAGKIENMEELMLDVLCFNCGVMFKVPVGTPNPTARCKECKD